MSVPILRQAEDTRRRLAEAYAPIARELEEAERVFAEELHSRYPFVQQLVEHCADFHGKRLRPALVLLSGQAAGSLTACAPGSGGGGGDDPHGDAGA